MRSRKLSHSQEAASMVANTINREFIGQDGTGTFSEIEKESLSKTVQILNKHASSGNHNHRCNLSSIPRLACQSLRPTNHNRRMIQIALDGYTVTRILQLSFFDSSRFTANPQPATQNERKRS
ncbi:hypothetical protein [Vibrio splendidus]|uniref:hypothetical protein n=1 Tax=Vibrio splendidus TaxID=29497 RepID=UPI003D0BD60D